MKTERQPKMQLGVCFSSVAALRSLYFHWPCKTQLLLFLGLGSIVVLFVLLLGLRVSNQWCETLRELLHHEI